MRRGTKMSRAPERSLSDTLAAGIVTDVFARHRKAIAKIGQREGFGAIKTAVAFVVSDIERAAAAAKARR